MRLFHKKESAEVFALIDSGTTISIFRPEVAGYLGIEIENGKAIDLNGVGVGLEAIFMNLISKSQEGNLSVQLFFLTNILFL